MISPDIILIWPGYNASIPSGFTRETTLDSTYIKGWGTAAVNTTGGTSTHSHSSPTHSHTINNHTHSGTTTRDSAYETHGGSCSNCAARDAHVHSWTSSSVNGGTLSNAITYASTSSEPPYHEVIFIKSTAYNFVPSSSIVFYGSGDLPQDFVICDGNNGSPNLDNKFLKGASTGANAGGTGGTLNHSHTVSHTHSAVNHSHSGSTGYDSDCCRDYSTGGGGGAVCPRHTHTFTTGNTSRTGSTYSGSAGTADTVQPAYTMLRPIYNTGSDSIFKGMIAMWLGSESAIPSGWLKCNGNNGTINLEDRWIKCTTSEGSVASTGGSNTHTHASSNSHTHTGSSHTHPSGGTSWQSVQGTTIATPDGAAKDHSHQTQTSSANTESYSSTTISANSSNGEPPYRTVIFIQRGEGASMSQIIG